MDRHLKEQIFRYKWSIAAILFSHLLSTVSLVGIIFCARTVIMADPEGTGSLFLNETVGTMAVLVAVSASSTYARCLLSDRISYNVVRDLRSEFYMKLLSAGSPDDLVDDRDSFQVMFVTQINLIQKFVFQMLNVHIGFPVVFAVLFVGTYYLDPYLILDSLLLLIAVCIVSYLMYRKGLAYKDMQFKTMTALYGKYVSTVRGARTMRFIGDYDGEKDSFAVANNAHGRANATMNYGTYFYPALVTVLVNMLVVSAYVYMGIAFNEEAQYIDDVVIAFQLFPLYTMCMSTVPLVTLSYPAVRLGWDSIRDMLDTEAPVRTGTPFPRNGDGPEVELEHVSHHASDEMVGIEDISLKVRKGEVLMVIGTTFSGKGTVGRIIANVTEPCGGSVRYRGIEHTDLDPRSLKDHIAYVGARSTFFKMDLRSNIDPLGRLGEKELEHLMHITDVDRIEERHKDLDIGSLGPNMSDGETQRVSFCRALAKDADIYVFDSAVHSIDLGSRLKLMGNVLSYLEGKTVVIVTHDTMFGPMADRIVFIEDGRLVAEGTHEELMEDHAPYRRLHDLENRKGVSR
ncbi:MAG: ABC transporter ATP-binding protein/permease [archaeon]|nr:ABC transporter ATP-binding protein/permease [archaeon]